MASPWWYCNVCNAQNHEEDGECQYCECTGADCKRDTCSGSRHGPDAEPSDFEIQAAYDSALEYQCKQERPHADLDEIVAEIQEGLAENRYPTLSEHLLSIEQRVAALGTFTMNRNGDFELRNP